MIECPDIKQGSEEWFKLRAGVITASNFDKIITSTGSPSKQAQKYIYQTAGEAILGTQEEGYSNTWMERGKELEPKARGLYVLKTGKEVRQVGFCFKDEKKIVGCSPDGLIDPDGVLEIKCPKLSTHTEYIDKDKLPVKYQRQVQGVLYVTGRKYCDFFSYYPGMKTFHITVERDEVFIKQLHAEIEKWVIKLNLIIKKLRME